MLNQTLALARLTLADPRAAVSVVLRWRAPRPALIEAMFLVAILGVLVAIGPIVFLAGTENTPTAVALFANPLWLAVIQVALLFLSVLAIFLIGRAFGGTGSFDAVFQVMVWLQLVIIGLQVVELPIVLLFPNLEGLLAVATAIFSLWLTVNFIAAVHGFSSLLKVFAGVIASSFILGFAMILVLAILGIPTQGA